jgi:hypothetical protein
MHLNIHVLYRLWILIWQDSALSFVMLRQWEVSMRKVRNGEMVRWKYFFGHHESWQHFYRHQAHGVSKLPKIFNSSKLLKPQAFTSTPLHFRDSLYLTACRIMEFIFCLVSYPLWFRKLTVQICVLYLREWAWVFSFLWKLSNIQDTVFHFPK